MPFDPSSAALVEEPEEKAFDPTSAVLVEEEQPGSLLDKVGQFVFGSPPKQMQAFREGKTLPTEEELNPAATKSFESPLVSAETIHPFVDFSQLAPMFPAIKDELAGVGEGVASAASSMTSPQNLSLLATGALGKTAQILLAAGFEAKAIHDAPEQYKSFQEATDPKEKAKIITEMALGLGVPVYAAGHISLGTRSVPGRPSGIDKLSEVILPKPEAPISEPIAATATDAVVAASAARTAPVVGAPIDARPVVSTEIPIKPTTGGRANMISRALQSRGVEPDVADHFALEAEKTHGTKPTEQLREEAFKLFDEAGGQFPKEQQPYSEDPNSYEAHGKSPEEIQQLVSDAKYWNDKAATNAHAKNRDILNERTKNEPPETVPGTDGVATIGEPVASPETTAAGTGESGGTPEPAKTDDTAAQPATEQVASADQPQSPTGIRNAIVDKERVERGLPERMAPIRKTNPEAWDAAMSKVDKNPNAGRELVEDIKTDPRALEPEESALLAHEQVTRENAFDNAVDDVNNSKTDSERLEAQQRLDLARNDVQEVYDAGQRVGTKSGQSLQARKILVNQDYTLARMEAIKRAVANDGKPLTEAQAGEVKAAHDELAKVKAELEKVQTAQAVEKQGEIYRQIVKEGLTSAKEAAKTGKTLQSVLDEAAAKARARIVARRGQLKVTIDPLNVAGLVDEAIVGASHIARGVTKFADWSAQMVKDFGERINPYLKDLWERARQYHDSHAKLFEKSGPKEPTTPKEILANVKAKATAGKELSQKDVYDLARAHVNAGVEGLDSVMAKVTQDLQDAHPGITEREVRDTFTDYGKTKVPSKEVDLTKLREYRRLGQLVSAIEDARNKETPKKSGMQRDKPTQAIREKMKELQKAMRENGIETTSPEDQLASTNQARATNLKNQIEDLEKEIATGQRTTAGAPLPDTPEVTALKVKRDALKAEVKGIREADPAYVAEQEARQLARYKSALAKRTADINERIANNDYEKRTPNKTKMDDEATRAKTAYETVRQKWETQVERDRLAKRPLWLKSLEQIAGTARASALSGYHTLLKLATYDLAKFIETPISEVAGAGISKIPGLRRISGKANLESGSTIRPLVDFYTQAATKGMKEAWRVLRTGKTEAKTLYGKPDYSPPKWYDFFGNLHMAEKAPLVTGTQAMYLRRAIENAIKDGLDPSNEFTKAAINKAVYDHSQKSILQENNAVAEAVNGLQARMEAVNPKTGHADVAKATLSTLFKTFITKGIVRTPANYIAQTIARTPIGLATGIAKAGMAHARGISNLHPIEANSIHALLKAGAVGSAMFVWGMIDATKDEEDRIFGGYWQPGRKRNDVDVDWGKIRVGEKQLPHLITHNPLTESAQMGSTIMRVAMSKFRKKDEDTQGLMQGAVKAVVGLAGKAPIASPMMRAGQGRNDVGADLITGLIPQLLQNIAEDTDAEERAPRNTNEKIKSAIPFLRETVPEK